jgi:hypothetical protein
MSDQEDKDRVIEELRSDKGVLRRGGKTKTGQPDLRNCGLQKSSNGTLRRPL